MKSAVESLSPTRVKLTIEVPFEELKPSVDEAYRKIAQQINVPGFRRGKVPPAIIDQRIGRGLVLEEAVNDALPQFYFRALQDNDVQALSQPEVDLQDFTDGAGLSFSAELDVRPQIVLPEYDGLEASVDDAQVTDEDVEEQLQALRERFATLKPVERPAGDGDFLTIDLTASRDGQPVEGAQATGISYEVGSGGLVEGLDDAVRGLSSGESATFASRLSGGDIAGQEVDVEVRVQAVKERELPAVDDDFAQSASEFDTVEELRADLRSRLERGRRLEQAAAARDAVLEALLERVDVPLPESAVEEEVASRREAVSGQLREVGLTEEEYLESEGQTSDEFAEDLRDRVRRALTAQFVLDEVAKAEQLSVDQEELSEHLVRRAAGAGVAAQQFADEVVRQGRVPELVAEVLRGKALARIVESAKVTDASGRPVDLKRLQPDGSLAEEAESDDSAVEPAAEPAEHSS